MGAEGEGKVVVGGPASQGKTRRLENGMMVVA